MKFRFFLVALLLLIANSMASAGISDWFYGRSWQFMESVGGIAIDEPTRAPDGTVNLPVKCDVSGLTTITKKPTLMNSALVLTGIEKKIKETQIMIAVKTGLAPKDSSCTCSGVDLGKIPTGDYQVYYYGADREKHSLGKVTIPAK